MVREKPQLIIKELTLIFYLGDTIRIRPNELLINTPSAYLRIYGNKANVRKADTYKAFRHDMRLINTLSEVDTAIHARKKKLLVSGFTDRALNSAENFIIQHVDRWCNLLISNEKMEAPQDMGVLADRLVFDIMCELLFGRSFETKESGKSPLKSVSRTLDNYMSLVYKVSLSQLWYSWAMQKAKIIKITMSPFLSSWLWLRSIGLNPILEKFKPKDMRLYVSLVHGNVFERIKDEETSEPIGSDRKDILYYLYHTKNTKTGESAFSRQELMLEASMLLTSCARTTTSVMAAFFFYITRNQYVYGKLTDEIRTVFPSFDDIESGQKLASCHYLHACLNEVLRTMPAIPSETMRVVLPGGLKVDDVFIPKGTLVGTSLWSLHRSDALFRDPWIFRPERWIINDDRGVCKEDVSRTLSAFFPFAIGPTQCPGQRLAKSILSITLAKTLFMMDVLQVPGEWTGAGHEKFGWGRRDRNVFQARDAFISLTEGPVINVRHRKSD